MPGLAQLVLKLETLGWKVAIASGGFTFFAEYLRDKLHLTPWSPMSWRSWTAS
jgi:phosphoserine phosphatase